MKILEQLKDDNLYYGEFGRAYLSSSTIKLLLNNPASYSKGWEDTKAFAMGKYFHQLILEPQKALEWLTAPFGSRNTKGYKEFCDSNGIDFALLDGEAREMKELVTVILGNYEFHEIIRHPLGEYEVPVVGEIMDHPFKGKADIVHPDCIYDLKTTSDIHKFKWTAKSYGYDIQAFIYQQLFGRPLVFLAIDKESGVLGKYTCSESFIKSGEEKVRKGLEIFDRYYGVDATDDVSTFYLEDEL